MPKAEEMKIVGAMAFVLGFIIFFIAGMHSLAEESKNTYWQEQYNRQVEISNNWCDRVVELKKQVQLYRLAYEHELNNEKWVGMDGEGNIVIVSEDGTITRVGE